MDEMRDYKPVQPRGGGPNVRKVLERLGGIAVLIGGLALKFGFIFIKFFSFFISVAAYTLLFHSWTFALGFVLLILVHELGHVVEARRQGLQVSAPMFIPFLGAYVKIRHAGLTPWRNALISLAGPAAGGAAAAVVWAIGAQRGSTMLVTLAYLGFFLNLFNLIPIGFLDGGQISRSMMEAWRMPVIQFQGDVPVQAFQPDRKRAVMIGTLYAGLAVLLAIGWVATKHAHGL